MTSQPIILGSRASPLARAQAEIAAAFLSQRGIAVNPQISFQTTTGDKIVGPLWQHKEGKALFVKDIQERLRRGAINLAVHSLKDLPLEPPSDLKIAAIIGGASPFDVIVFREAISSIGELPPKARIGTSSLRRILQLELLRPDCSFIPLRGNVGTRLERLAQGDFEAIVIAQAGLERLGTLPPHSQILPATMMVPAFNQGLIGLECLASAQDLCLKLNTFSCEKNVKRYVWERAIAQLFGASCHSAIGVHAEPLESGLMRLSIFTAQSSKNHRFFSIEGSDLEKTLCEVRSFFEIGQQDWSQCLFNFT